MTTDDLLEWWAPCPTCGKPRLTTRAHPTREGLCQCAVKAFEREIDAEFGERAPVEEPGAVQAKGWRDHFGKRPQDWPSWLNPRWGEESIGPRDGISAGDLQVVGCIFEHYASQAPVGNGWKGWCNGLAAIYQNARGDWAIIEQTAKECAAREPKFRPPTVAQRVGADKPNGFAIHAGKLWAAGQQEKRPRATPRADAQAAAIDRKLGGKRATG